MFILYKMTLKIYHKNIKIILKKSYLTIFKKSILQ